MGETFSFFDKIVLRRGFSGLTRHILRFNIDTSHLKILYTIIIKPARYWQLKKYLQIFKGNRKNCILQTVSGCPLQFPVLIIISLAGN